MFVKLTKGKSYRYTDEMGDSYSFVGGKTKDVPAHVAAKLLESKHFVQSSPEEAQPLPAKEPSRISMSRNRRTRTPRSVVPPPKPIPEEGSVKAEVGEPLRSMHDESSARYVQTPITNPASQPKPTTQPKPSTQPRPSVQSSTCLREDPNKGIVDLNTFVGKNVLFVRQGGIGDLLFITPIVRRLKEIVPDIHIDVATSEVLKCLLTKNPHINTVLTLKEAKVQKSIYDHIFNFTGGIAANSAARDLHCVDALCSWVGLDLEIKDKTLDLVPIQGQLVEARKLLQPLLQKPGRLIGLGTMASAQIRTWPTTYTRDLIQTIMDQTDAKVLLIGKTREPKSFDGFPLDRVASVINSTTLAKTVGLISRLDGFVGTDSGLLHIAQALRKPLVGLFGPFNSEIRMNSEFESSISVDADCPCRPCYSHDSSLCDHMDDKGDVDCMKAILPTIVFRALKEMLEIIDIREIQNLE